VTNALVANATTTRSWGAVGRLTSCYVVSTGAAAVAVVAVAADPRRSRPDEVVHGLRAFTARRRVRRLRTSGRSPVAIHRPEFGPYGHTARRLGRQPHGVQRNGPDGDAERSEPEEMSVSGAIRPNQARKSKGQSRLKIKRLCP
jgi:hypothetical protein